MSASFCLCDGPNIPRCPDRKSYFRSFQNNAKQMSVLFWTALEFHVLSDSAAYRVNIKKSQVNAVNFSADLQCEGGLAIVSNIFIYFTLAKHERYLRGPTRELSKYFINLPTDAGMPCSGSAFNKMCFRIRIQEVKKETRIIFEKISNKSFTKCYKSLKKSKNYTKMLDIFYSYLYSLFELRLDFRYQICSAFLPLGSGTASSMQIQIRNSALWSCHTGPCKSIC